MSRHDHQAQDGVWEFLYDKCCLPLSTYYGQLVRLFGLEIVGLPGFGVVKDAGVFGRLSRFDNDTRHHVKSRWPTHNQDQAEAAHNVESLN